MSQLLPLGDIFSQSQMMSGFSSCASLTAVLSAFDNLKTRYNSIKKENKRLKDKIAKYEENHPDSTIEKEKSPRPAPRRSSKMKLVDARVQNVSNKNTESRSIQPVIDDVHPTVRTIVDNISDQLTLIGLQLESLLLDFDRIETKEEIYKVHETVKTVILPRLIEIRHKELECAFTKDGQGPGAEDISKCKEQIYHDTSTGATDEDAEEVTENLLKLQRLLRQQNVMLKNFACLTSESSGDGVVFKLEGQQLPLDGWSVI